MTGILLLLSKLYNIEKQQQQITTEKRKTHHIPIEKPHTHTLAVLKACKRKQTLMF